MVEMSMAFRSYSCFCRTKKVNKIFSFFSVTPPITNLKVWSQILAPHRRIGKPHSSIDEARFSNLLVLIGRDFF